MSPDADVARPATSAAETARLLQQTPLLRGLPDSAIEELSRHSRTRRYRHGEAVFLQDDPGDSLFVVAKGLVKVFVTSPRGDDLVLATVGPGNTFGELALLDGG
ncbi:MAG: cyclic nucleotide-binding domain-containing protein, partial [Candidatus Dormibacteraeota bacterium]|nr:cyclic nucleotide-binding domain-containing protein [Candidatus Dormibacteraeota bacterium]